MNILLINHYAGSNRHGMEFRPFYMGREWVRAGHRVQIVAASFSHVRAIQPELNGAVPACVDDGGVGVVCHALLQEKCPRQPPVLDRSRA